MRELEDVWREHAASMRGALVKRLGDLDRAEEALQEAVAQALRHWPDEGVPANPAGWLVTTAWRKAVDQLRREEVGKTKIAYTVPIGAPDSDDLLALIFGCCHPSLPEQARIALTLRAVCGLTTEEIAAAFLVPVPTMAQRLTRAKKLVRSRFGIPGPEEYGARLGAVLTVIYLLYNEGYLANSSTTAQRRDLATQALALARQLELLMPGEPEVIGLGVLLDLCEARSSGRFDTAGNLVLLADQDRSTWDSALIKRAVQRLDRVLLRRKAELLGRGRLASAPSGDGTAAGSTRPPLATARPGPYQIHAAIAALHATAPSYADTDWLQIRMLYMELHRHTGNPLALLSASVATWHARDASAGLAEVSRLAGELDGYRLYHATKARMLQELGREDEARSALERALSLTVNPAEKALLTDRLLASA
ncbi:RNA polymerase sigma factor [Allorhizocola rhizosphaerae]|uniref:RNA polymerase sigma factor n=1 Tax=Allorhizocola rhizosphaerae TaxID=1872709 RepID=UPI001FE6E4CE|nr:DUF6596 domain-containing protein [Allorhizocola rhizosphaerae]